MLHCIIHSSFVELLHFRLYSTVFSILQFLGNFLRSIPGEDGSSSPIHDTSVFSDAGLYLPNDWLSMIVVFEIQAHAVTRIVNILNFFAPNFGSPCCTQSSIIFSELMFRQENPVELSVQSVLGDLVHQKRILCESEESDSQYCSADYSLTSTLSH